jgi:L-lactate dehydrogenase (cytochrome)/(S)-mandelate dehydrogenase
MKASEAASIRELRDLAHRRLPKPVFELLDSGAGDGSGLRRNVDAFRSHQLVPRVLTEMAEPDQSTSLFGQRFSSPFGISATGMAGLFWPKADLLLAEAAAAANIPFMLSTCSTDSIAHVARIAPHHVWFQLYPAREQAVSAQMIARAREAAIGVLVVTVDWPIQPRFETPSIARRSTALSSLIEGIRHPGWAWRYFRNGGRPRFANWAAYAPAGSGPAEILRYTATQWPCHQTWKDITRFRDLWPGKLVLKGIAHPDDARHARQIGVDGLVVSNHGGKASARFPATVDMLPAIKAAVGDTMAIMIDGGIEQGADVVVSRCLGAGLAFFGRLTLYGAAAGGREGIKRVIDLLRQDISTLQSQLGCASYDRLTPEFLFDPIRGPRQCHNIQQSRARQAPVCAS